MRFYWEETGWEAIAKKFHFVFQLMRADDSLFLI